MPVVSRPDVTPPAVGRTGFAALLVARGLVSPDGLSAATTQAAHDHTELHESLVALGLVTEADVSDAVATAAGAPLIALDGIIPGELAVRVVPERLARRYLVVPLNVDNGTLTYATCRPFDAEADDDLAFASGRRTKVLVASRSAVLDALDRAYPRLRDLDALAARLRIERPASARATGASESAFASTVEDLCLHLLARAVEVGASDMHIECGLEGTIIRFRVCGVLEQVLALPASVSGPIRNRFKILARADIAVRHKAQDGAFQVTIGGRAIAVRFSSLPTVGGEKLVLRVVDTQSPLPRLDRLGYDGDTQERFERALARPQGLVIVAGPTGSGTTTALYACLEHLRRGHTNVVSVEDQVERTIPGVTQVPVNSRAGNTCATVLQSLLGQDPDVVMIGEVADGEVAQIAGRAASTGRLVLASLQAVDTATAVARLLNFGLEPFKLAENLTAILAQRLVRTLCSYCRRVHGEAEARRLAEVLGLAAIPASASAGPGCVHCKRTGYLGRLPIAELLTPTQGLRVLIERAATAAELRAAMRATGSATLRGRALQLVVQGKTSIEEVDRVLAAEDPDTMIARKRVRLRVLVVDDEPITRMLVKLLLEREQFDVIEASNGQQALTLAVRERPDLTLIDLNMPEMDGYEAIGHMRGDFSLATMPIVVLTGEDGSGVERRVLDLGADDYLVKPFEPAVLLSRVQGVFERLKVSAV